MSARRSIRIASRPKAPPSSSHALPKPRPRKQPPAQTARRANEDIGDNIVVADKRRTERLYSEEAIQQQNRQQHEQQDDTTDTVNPTEVADQHKEEPHDDDDDEECGWCFDPLSAEPLAHFHPCGHAMHEPCLRLYFQAAGDLNRKCFRW